MTARPPAQRPAFCVESRCRCCANVGADSIEQGGSVLCAGINTDPARVHFTAGQTEHANDLHLCVYTPIRGWVKLNVNAGDFDALAWVAGHTLRAAGQIESWIRAVGREQVLNDSAMGGPPAVAPKPGRFD